MNEREVPPILVVGIIVSLAVMLLCYAILPSVGAAAVIGVDRLAFGFRWLGARHPVTGWALLGAAIGGLIGAGMGLKRAGLPRQAPRLAALGAGALVALFALGLLYTAIMPPTR